MSRDDHNEGARVAAEGRDPEWNKPWPRPSESSEEYQQRVEDFERGYFQTVGQRDGAEGRTLKSESTYRFLDLDHNQMRDDAYQFGHANGERHRPSEGDAEAGSSSVFGDASDDEPREEIDSSPGFCRDYSVSTVTHSKPKSDSSESSAKFAYGALAFLGLMIVLGATAEPKRDSGKEEDFGSRVACAVMVFFGVLLFIAFVAACFLK